MNDSNTVNIAANKKTMVKIPLSNVYAKGDYTAEVCIGSEKSKLNLIIDTGSSTLVIKEQQYQPQADKDLITTTLAQEVNYGMGGFNGPVIKTTIEIADDNNTLRLKNVPIAVVSNTKQKQTFGKSDGILGLAYHQLNKGFDVKETTYPWPFAKISDDLKSFKHFLWQFHEHDITPYFTSLAQHQLCANKFAFYSKRSSIHYNHAHSVATDEKQRQQAIKLDELNQGVLLLGSGEEQTDLYHGNFKNIKVSHDIYYNVELLSMQVGDNAPIKAPPLENVHKKNYLTNAIIDTGAGGIVLTANIYQQLITELTAVNSSFAALLSPFADLKAQEVGINANLIDLNQWPTINFTFVGEQNQPIMLSCQPHTYWQLNTPSYGKACFHFISQLPQWPNQSIIGLPLLNNYYVVFDRSEHKTGVIKFAQQK